MKGKVDKSIQRESDIKSYFPWLILLLVFMVYGNTINHEYAVDDTKYIESSFVKKGISSLPEILTKGSQQGSTSSYLPEYRPMVLLNFALEKSVFGSKPFVHHFFNIFLYGLLCIFIFKLMVKLFKNFSIHFPIAITLLFILHPLHTEVVANIKGRDEILAMLFGILCLLHIYNYQISESRSNRFMLFSLLFFLLLIMTKESGYSYLGLIPLMLYYFSKSSLKRIALITLPFFAVAAIGVFIRMQVLKTVLLDEQITVFDNSLVAANSVMQGFATVFTIMWHVLSLLIFPLTLSWDYSVNQFPLANWSSPKVILSICVWLFFLVVAILGIKKRSVISFSVFFFIISYFITSNLVIRIASTFAERFLFVPSLAFCIALPLLISLLFKSDLHQIIIDNKNRSMGYLLLAFMLFFAIRTIGRNDDWKNNYTIYKAGVTDAPNSARTHFSYANELRVRAEKEGNAKIKSELAINSISEYKRGLELYRDTNSYMTFYNIGVLYYAIGDNKNALISYDSSISLNNKYPPALNNSGVIYFMQNDLQSAYTCFSAAAILDTNYVDAIVNAGACKHKLSDYRSAVYWYRKGFERNPSNMNLVDNLISVYSQLGNQDSVAYFSSLKRRI